MPARVSDLAVKARKIRETIVTMLAKAGSGHSAGPLGTADFWTLLYFGGQIDFKAEEPWWEERDRVVLSAGHYCPVLYAVLAEAGFFEKEKLATLRQVGSPLQGHPVVRSLPGIETSSGPLGQGISQAIGMALAARLDGKRWRVICFMGDGEQDEGQVWEAYLCASRYRLANLTVVIDRNNIQIDGRTEEVMPLEPLRQKLEAFNFLVLEVDGHDFWQMAEALQRAKTNLEGPTVVILRTTPGKGVSFMENDFTWHGKAPSPAEAEKALKELGS